MTFFDYPGTAGAQSDASTGDVFLADATEQDWIDLLAATGHRLVGPGETVIARGDTGRSLYLVVSGTLEVRLPGSRFARARRLATIGAGRVIGEVAFFDGEARTADVVATEAAEVAELTPAALAALAERRPQLATAVLVDLGRILARRLRTLQEESEWNRR